MVAEENKTFAKKMNLQWTQINNPKYTHMSGDMRFPTMWYVQPAQTQTSLRIRAV